MHASHFAIIAIDLANERVREAEAAHRYRDALRRPSTPGIARRSAARAAASFSRSLAGLARRLDAASLDGRRSAAH
jgi:hypothetical protein